MTPKATLSVLSVSPSEQDHLCLQAIIGHSRWRLLKADGVEEAIILLGTHDVSVVFCERDLGSETWIDMLSHIQTMSDPPTLVVTSNLADARLWAEALNLGAWDVVAKPFDRVDVIRSVKLAWDHWHGRRERKPLMRVAAG
jgi:DNA-binding NtrC family response regulator